MTVLHRLATAAAMVALCSGCTGDDPGAPAPTAPDAPTLVAEPAFTAGTENTVSWVPTDGGDWEFEAQRAADPEFARDAETTGWTEAGAHTFSGLADGAEYYFRVRARRPGGPASAWSAAVRSRQDASPPVAALDSLRTGQLSLRFGFAVGGSDAGSGVAAVEVWMQAPDAEPVPLGEYAPGPVTVQADRGGPHAFHLVAVDVVGNRQPWPEVPQGLTEVPEPIIITDATGEDFDITNAVLAHNMHLRYWEYGYGRLAIRPVVDPHMLSPGDPGYPEASASLPVVAVAFGDDVRAYSLFDLEKREVVDDVVDGVPIAAAY